MFVWIEYKVGVANARMTAIHQTTDIFKFMCGLLFGYSVFRNLIPVWLRLLRGGCLPQPFPHLLFFFFFLISLSPLDFRILYFIGNCFLASPLWSDLSMSSSAIFSQFSLYSYSAV